MKEKSEIPNEDSTNFQDRTTVQTPRRVKPVKIKRVNAHSCKFRFTARYFSKEKAYRIVKLTPHNHCPEFNFSVSQ